MESLTKARLDAEAIQRIVERALGPALRVESSRELTHGWFNAVHALSFGDAHPDLVLRVAPHRDATLLTYERDLMRAEVAWYEHLAEHPGIPLPRLVAFQPADEELPHDVMLLERVAGESLLELSGSLGEADELAVEIELGKLARAIHAVEGARFGYPHAPELSGATWGEALRRFVAALLADAARVGAELPVEASRIEAAFSRQTEALDSTERPGLVHWDLAGGNVVIERRDEGPRIAAILDWERAFFGERFAECNFFQATDGFLEGYGLGREELDARAASRTLDFCFLLLVMIVEAPTRFGRVDHVRWAEETLVALLRDL